MNQAKFLSFWPQMKIMTKIRLFYSGTMALILPQLKDIANFVYTPLVKVNHAKFLLFWSQMKDMTKIRLFNLVLCYSDLNL